MRKIFGLLVIFLLFGCAPCCFAQVRNIQDNYKFVYNITDSLGAHVSGQTVSLKIQRASDGYFYDFASSTFKNSGWTNKTTNLSEDAANGLYCYTFDPPSSETSAQQYVFVIDNTDSTYGDHQSTTVTYQNIGDPWAADISSGYAGKAGEALKRVDQDTNGIKDGSDYSGVEKLIRVQR